jgi:hypothetical protein
MPPVLSYNWVEEVSLLDKLKNKGKKACNICYA